MKRILLVGAALAAMVSAAAPRAKISFGTGGTVETFKSGVRIFGTRHFVLAKDLPPALEGQAFLRRTIEWTGFDVTADGDIWLLTPPAKFTDGKEPSADAAIEKAGFVSDPSIPVFQLFGRSDKEKVHAYRKFVKKGEHYEFKYWALVVGFDPAPAAEPVRDVPRETLYNGIVLETNPKDRTPMAKYGRYPLPVPYLDRPPAVISVDIGRQLFVDDFLIGSTTMTRTWHKAQKDPRNPVLRPETDLERGKLGPFNAPMSAPFSGGVWYDGRDALYKCWYCAGWFDGTAYAWSTNGVDWVRPELKAVPGTNRIVKPETADGKRCNRDSAAVVMDPDATDGYRFKLFLWSRPQGGELFVSKNGTDWEGRTACGDSGDRSTIFYNPFRKVWCYSLRSFWSARARNYAECADFLAGASYPNEVVWMRTDCRDQPERSWIYCDPDRYFDREPNAPSLYNLDVVAYESLMLGAFSILSGADNGDCGERMVPKMTDLHLGFSRDGFHFSRAEDRSPFIAGSRRAGAWDRGYLHSNAALCLVRDDELLFYYTGFSGHSDDPTVQDGLYTQAQMGIARLRRDGFASMDAGACGGELVTRPIVFTRGDRLYVNANAAGGELKAELVDENGQVLAASQKAFSGNATKAVVLEGLAPFAGKTVRIRFTAKDAQLYAFWFSDAAGRSRGYLAGGSPSAKGLRDED